MARTKKVNDIPLQLNLSTKRLFDAHLILAISDYLNDKNNKMTKLLKSLVEEAMEENDKYPHFSSLVFDESIEFPSYFPKTKRVVVVFSDEKQINFLLEVQKEMKLTDYARYLFLKHFYGVGESRTEQADNAPKNPQVDFVGKVGSGVGVSNGHRELAENQKKKIIKPLEYVEKPKEKVAKKKSSRTGFGDKWVF